MTFSVSIFALYFSSILDRKWLHFISQRCADPFRRPFRDLSEDLFFMHFGRPLAHFLPPFGFQVIAFWLPSASFWLQLASFWHPLAPFGSPLGSIFVSLRSHGVMYMSAKRLTAPWAKWETTIHAPCRVGCPGGKARYYNPRSLPCGHSLKLEQKTKTQKPLSIYVVLL